MPKFNPKAKAIVSSTYPSEPFMAGFARYGFMSAIAEPFNVKALGTILSHR